MKRKANKKVAGVLAGTVLISLTCSTAYADIPWEPTPRLPDGPRDPTPRFSVGPISLYFIALMVLAVIVAAVIIIRSNFKKKGDARNNADAKADKQDKEV